LHATVDVDMARIGVCGDIGIMLAAARSMAGPFMALLGKVLPTQARGEDRGGIAVKMLKPQRSHVR
jgi:hypothetical protein